MKIKENKKKRHDPLHVQMDKDVHASAKKKNRTAHETQVGSEYLDAKTSKKILKEIKKQQIEIKNEEFPEENVPSDHESLHLSEVEEYDDDQPDYFPEDFEQADLDPEELALIQKFMATGPAKQLDLAELIEKKLTESPEEQENTEKQESDINPRVVQVYTKLGSLLSRYKSGKLPKAFKILPTLSRWQDILELTKPEEWTANATYEATRLFISNLKASYAQQFLSIVMIDKVRSDIQQNKKLNYHLYMALKKALYKPAAFFKGFLLPLLEDDCTLREAVIISSILQKVSVPILHSSAFLLKLTALDPSPCVWLLIRVLLDKKYALPYRVIDELVFYFIRYEKEERQLPVLWYQAALIFAQRYKEDMTVEQKEALINVVQKKAHYQITPEIVRELRESIKSRDMQDVEMLM